MMKNADTPAMPLTQGMLEEYHIHPADSTGMTKREMMAMHLMASWVNHHGSAGGYGFSPQEAAGSAVECADALLKELEK